MRRKLEILQAIKQFAKEIGVPTSMIADLSSEQMSHDVRNFCNDIGTTLWALEEGTPWSNKAELYIYSSRRQSERTCMNQTPRCPYGTIALKDEQGSTTSQQRTTLNYMEQRLILQPWLRRVTYHPFANLDGSNYCEQTAAFPHNCEVLGRVLGPARGEDNQMAQWVLKTNGRVVPHRSLWPLTIAEKHSMVESMKRDVFDALIERRLGTSNNSPPTTED